MSKPTNKPQQQKYDANRTPNGANGLTAKDNNQVPINIITGTRLKGGNK